ncbi:GTPase Era [Brumimicrobium oceani]|uniref:GTPase Era n=1 Tax=Brumimicrobium oceani TaxID=2100725 RepID=A0A2U2XDI6_9FLAO|nr:GTPase Era [Brumimicrobium oceani]PWH85810.1 GTPase Era [Brumimicrobium oceani]
MSHKSGFVNIVGSPNVGKSTLMNRLLGEKLSIVTSKAQTTRHRIRGILNHEDYQIVFSDTPGVVNAAYGLHESMMKYVDSSIKDADVLLFITDIFENTMNHKETLERIKLLNVPVICLVNKVDLKDQKVVAERLEYWSKELPNATVLPISALHKFNVEPILNLILDKLPDSPAFFDKEAISDRPMRFFISEIIREKIFLNLKKEVPYACEVEVTDYVEEEDIIRIRANIIVERDSQKGILIGAKGRQLKYIGIDSRKDIEKFVDKHVFLETFVKVDKDWRNNDGKLKKYGY